MTARRITGLLRIAFAALALVAVGVQLFGVTVPSGFSVVDFFSYFTNLSNLALAAVLLIGGVRLLRGAADPGATAVALRGASVVCIALVGLVFNTLLTDVPLGGLIPWVNTVLHIVMPIAGVLDWLVRPPRLRIPLRTALIWPVFPVVYTIYSLVRGAATGFYPYPFFDPAANGGYGGVAAYCVVLVVALLLLALLVRWAGNALGARRSRIADAPA